MGTGGSFPRVKRPGLEADYSSASSAEIKNAWSGTSIHPYVFMVWCLIKQGTRRNAMDLLKHRDNFPLPYKGKNLTAM
jgi:hypothetical protein